MLEEHDNQNAGGREAPSTRLVLPLRTERTDPTVGSSAVPMQNFESEADHDLNKVYFADQEEDSRIGQEVSWLTRLYQRRCCLCSTFIFLLFFVWWATATNKSCWAKMSAAHASNRNVNSQLFLVHQTSESAMSEASISTVGQHPHHEIRFLVIGNFGRDGWCYQTDSAFELEVAARTMKASFIINPGNAFFPAGIMSPDEEQLRTSWSDVYNQPTVSSLKWYSALGEAEELGDPHALMTFSKANSRFVLDAAYYDKVIHARNGEFSLHLLFLDTTSLIRTKKKQNDEQLIWLAKNLEKSNATMKLVIGFHTPFSDPTMSAFLVPILENENNGATAYFSGRERSLQWYKKTRTHYFVSGAGAEFLKNENPFSTPHFVSSSSGFLACSAGFKEKTGEPRLKVAFVSSVGEVSKVVDTTGT